VGLAGAGWSQEQDVVPGDDEVERPEVGDELTLESAGVVEVEVLRALAAGEAGSADPTFTAVAVSCGDLALQAGDEELLVRPALGPARARSASRSTQSRNVGALSARVRKATSAVRSRVGVTVLAAIRRPPSRGQY
jgi:hypothetical protein